MKLIMIKEKVDTLKECQDILTEIRMNMEGDYPEITEYSISEVKDNGKHN